MILIGSIFLTKSYLERGKHFIGRLLYSVWPDWANFRRLGYILKGQANLLSYKIRSRNWRIFGLLFEEDNFLIFLLYKKFQNRLWCRYSKVSNLVWCRYFWAWKRLWCRYFGTWKAWATFLGVNRWLGLQKFQYAWSHCTLA